MSKRFTKTAINWTDLQKRVPPEQASDYFAFMSKCEIYMRRMQDNPAEPPKINWEQYKKLVPVPDLVDKLKAAYEAFKVPYPQDTMSAKVDEQWKILEPEIKAFCADVQKDIEAAKKELARINALPKFDEITMEMYYDLYPKEAIDPVNRPTFWPHTPDEQEGYKPSDQEASAKEH